MNRSDIIKMFEMKVDGNTYKTIADHFGVSKQYVHQTLTDIINPNNANNLRLKKCVYSHIANAMTISHQNYKSLAKELGISESQVRLVLIGKQKMSVAFAEKIADFFELTFEQVIKINKCDEEPEQSKEDKDAHIENYRSEG